MLFDRPIVAGVIEYIIKLYTSLALIFKTNPHVRGYYLVQFRIALRMAIRWQKLHGSTT